MYGNYTPEEAERKRAGEEIWRWIPGYEGRYKISDQGRVLSAARQYKSWNGAAWCVMNRRARIMSPDACQEQYGINLSKNGNSTRFGVAELVLTVFVCPRPEGKEICHFPDSDRSNNRLENLRWDTSQANQRDKIIHGTTTRGRRVNSNEANGMAKLTMEQAEQIRAAYIPRKVTQQSLADRFGIGISQVCEILKGRSWRPIPVDSSSAEGSQ